MNPRNQQPQILNPAQPPAPAIDPDPVLEPVPGPVPV